jgi:hypothetical protein
MEVKNTSGNLNTKGMEKYYTPEIEEFYVGFEYEIEYYDHGHGGGWIKMDTSNPHDIYQRKKELESNSKVVAVRVKYLDREDIESLDFAREPVKYHHSFIRGDYKLCYLSDDNPTELTILKRKKSNYLGESKYKLIFVGTIKNKSELKRILKQIGI